MSKGKLSRTSFFGAIPAGPGLFIVFKDAEGGPPLAYPVVGWALPSAGWSDEFTDRLGNGVPCFEFTAPSGAVELETGEADSDVFRASSAAEAIRKFQEVCSVALDKMEAVLPGLDPTAAAAVREALRAAGRNA